VSDPSAHLLDVPADPGAARAARRRLLLWVALVIALLGLAAAWTWTPLRDFIDTGALVDWLGSVAARPWAPLVVLAGFLLGGLLALPVTLMVVLTVGAFGPAWGFVLALAGSSASGMLSFWIGRRLGRQSLERLAGGRVHRLSERLGTHGFTTIALLRMVPVAHFTVISLSAGASHIRVRDFLLGTVAGMAPGLAAMTLFVDQLAAVARDPGPRHFLAVSLVGAILLATLLVVRALIRRRARHPARDI